MKFKLPMSLIFISYFTFCANAFATAQTSPQSHSLLEQFLSPISYEVHQVKEDPLLRPSAAEIIDDCRPAGLTEGEEGLPGVDDLNQIIAVGEKLWKLIEAGRPVVSFRSPLVHALPVGGICWANLESWRPPVSQLWEVNYKNGFNMNVVKFRFRVVYTAGGKYDGVGSYLANVTVMPATLDVSWGYTVNAEAVVGRAINLGTKDNPIAGLQLMVTWNVKTIVKDSTQSESIFIRADQ